MLEHLSDGQTLTAYIASNFVFGVDLHDYLGGLFRQAICANRALVVVPFAAAPAEELAAVGVLALHGLVYNFLADAT